MSNVLVQVKRGKIIERDFDSFTSPLEAVDYSIAVAKKEEELRQEKSVKQQMRIEKDCRYYESLKTALSHQQRFGLLSDMSMAALKKIALSEHIDIKGLRTKKSIVDSLLHVIEGRYDTLDKGEHVYIPDEFGLPMCGDDTPLNSAYIQLNKKAVDDIQRVINQDLNAQAITVEAREISQQESLPVNHNISVDEFRNAYEDCDDGIAFVKIPDMRKKLGWSREAFDDMLRDLRDKEVLQIYIADESVMTKDKVNDCFVDENGYKMGTVTWEKDEVNHQHEVKAIPQDTSEHEIVPLQAPMKKHQSVFSVLEAVQQIRILDNPCFYNVKPILEKCRKNDLPLVYQEITGSYLYFQMSKSKFDVEMRVSEKLGKFFEIMKFSA